MYYANVLYTHLCILIYPNIPLSRSWSVFNLKPMMESVFSSVFGIPDL